MRLVDPGDDGGVGFFAVSQRATGIIAFGQMATGVIAIGQLARGVIAVGQGAIGLVAIGQGALGIFYGTGMVGVAGRKGYGLVLPLIPSVGAPRVPPEATSFAAVHAGGVSAEGWVPALLGRDTLGLGLYEDGQRLPVKLDRRLQARAEELAVEAAVPVYAHTRREGDVLVCSRLVFVPDPPYKKRGFLLLAGLQLVGLLGVGMAFWPLAGNDVWHAAGKVFGGHHAGAPSHATPPKHPKSR